MTQRGICCPKHPKARLEVVTSRRAATGIIVRYRRCQVCGYKVPTEERVRTTARKRTTP